jgi:DNA mismatch repair protein MutS
MCGIPLHAIDTYVQKLIKLGFLVAICDQTEPPSEAKLKKKLVERDITRLYVN